MFPFTEAWAAEYLGGVISLLVFALGIPTLILQFAVPEELRTVSSRRLKWLRRISGVVSLIAASAALLFVWYIHPCSLPLDVIVPDSYTQYHVWPSVLVTVVVVVILVVWFFQTEEYRRDVVIRSLQKRCVRSIRSRGILAERFLSDLIYLGQQGNAGREKHQVLKAFDELAALLQDRPQYVGDGLADLVYGIETTMMGGEKTGELGNFLQAAGVLERIILRLQKPEFSAAPDTAIVLWTLERLGVASLDLGPERAALAILQVVASAAEGQDEARQFASERLFGIGRSALTDGQHFLVAVAALSKLEALAERRTPLRGEVAADLLGLLAHFWASGRTARRHAKSVLERMEELFDPSLLDRIRAAIEHQYRTAKFDTADKLGEMLEDLARHDGLPGS